MKGRVAVAEFDNRLQAEVVANLLLGFGVPSWIVADDLGGIGPGQSFLHGVKVVVDPEDVDRAREILDSSKRNDRGVEE